ncbi:hypothetical protein MRX96_016270 [Rhipicephalus microplus]
MRAAKSGHESAPRGNPVCAYISLHVANSAGRPAAASTRDVRGGDSNGDKTPVRVDARAQTLSSSAGAARRPVGEAQSPWRRGATGGKEPLPGNANCCPSED